MCCFSVRYRIGNANTITSELSKEKGAMVMGL